MPETLFSDDEFLAFPANTPLCAIDRPQFLRDSLAPIDATAVPARDASLGLDFLWVNFGLSLRFRFGL